MPEAEYGPRLSDDEYEKRILGLYRGLPPLPSPEQDREVRRLEFDLAIDHRLGRNFPEARRSALWAAQERVERKRLLLGAKYLLRRLAAGLFASHARSLAGCAAEEYGKVLSPEELERFLDLRNGEPPALPVDIDRTR